MLHHQPYLVSLCYVVWPLRIGLACTLPPDDWIARGGCDDGVDSIWGRILLAGMHFISARGKAAR